jgi:hypothetical protein
MIGALAQKAAMPASRLGELMPPDSAGFSLPTGFAELLGKLGLIGRGEKPAVAAQPEAEVQTMESPGMASVLKMLPPGIAKAFNAPDTVEAESLTPNSLFVAPAKAGAYVSTHQTTPLVVREIGPSLRWGDKIRLN